MIKELNELNRRAAVISLLTQSVNRIDLMVEEILKQGRRELTLELVRALEAFRELECALTREQYFDEKYIILPRAFFAIEMSPVVDQLLEIIKERRAADEGQPMLKLPNLPRSIRRSQIDSALEALGLDHPGVETVRIGTHTIEVTRVLCGVTVHDVYRIGLAPTDVGWLESLGDSNP